MPLQMTNGFGTLKNGFIIFLSASMPHLMLVNQSVPLTPFGAVTARTSCDMIAHN